MDEEFWSVQQPLALWSPSGPAPAGLSQPFSNEPGCSTPLASPVQKAFPPPPSYHPPPPFSLDQFGQSTFCSPPAHFQQQMPPAHGWPSAMAPPVPHHQQQQQQQHPPLYCAPPPPPHFAQHSNAAAVPSLAQLEMPPAFPPMMGQNGAVHGYGMDRPNSSLAEERRAGALQMGGHQQQQQREQRRCVASQQKVQQWQQFGNGQVPLQDSGVHSMSQSTANSVMSMSSIHPVSCISAVSSLPDEFPGLQEHPYFQHMPASIRHEEPEKMRKVVPELIPLINDEAEEIVLRALTILSSIARKDKELAMGRAPLDRPLIGERRVVEELLRTLKTHKRNKKVACYALRALHFISDNEPSGRELFVQTVSAHGTGCLEELVHCIGIQEHSCFKYAFLVLHNLMSDPRIGRKVIAYMCEMRILTKVLGWLEDKNEKFLNIVTDVLHMLINRNGEQMAFFLGLNGHQKLTSLLANSQQETLLYRTTKLLNRIVQMDPAKMVSAGLFEAAQRHLGQASQRLLRQILDCIRAVSHVPSSGHEVQPLLQKLLQLLGTNDMRLKESCTDILANLSANNAQNKEFLVETGAIYGLFQLLHELEALDEALGPSQQREGIQERALALLKSLCSGNARAGLAKRQCLGADGHKRVLLERLRQQRNLPLLRRTLMLLHQLANEDQPELLCSLRFALSFPPPFPQLPDAPLARHGETCSFASQTVLLLHQAMNCLPQNADICQRCLDILRAMAKDGLLLDEVFAELRARRFRPGNGEGRLMAPQALLCFFDQLAPNSVALLAELARIPEAAQMLQKDQPTLNALQAWANSETQTAQLARRTLQLICTHGEVSGNGQYFDDYQRQAQAQPQFAIGQFDGGEELAAVLNNSPAQMDFSPGHSSSSQPVQMPNGEQLAPYTNSEPFSDFSQTDTFPAFPAGQDEFSADFCPFVSAICPDSPSWPNPT